VNNLLCEYLEEKKTRLKNAHPPFCLSAHVVAQDLKISTTFNIFRDFAL